MRSSLALIATGVVVVALTACSTGPAPLASPGASTEAVTVTGELGSEPKVEFPTPLTPTKTQCEVLTEGEGDRIADGQLVEAAFVVYDGGTGERVGGAGYEGAGGTPLVRGTTQSNLALDKGLSCAREGSRVLIAAADFDAFGTGEATPGADPENGAIIVLDVLRAFPTKATGAPQLTRDGFPAVVLAPDGTPGITVPKTDPPADAKEHSQAETLKAGNGPAVAEGDTVIVQVTGVNWDDNSVLPGSTWEAGQPSAVLATSDVTKTSTLPIGAVSALIGAKVGSQIGVIVPPAEAISTSSQAPSQSAQFFVIDILGVV
ncbi:hypothetical protein ROT00_06690 [Agromyces mediolanus]|uniref:FKBP-type peptidyl-prolyl cis-trans isomerase n=1 Tax=Agromyces mediolanus TaxID=41986 RepID=UPI003837276A